LLVRTLSAMRAMRGTATTSRLARQLRVSESMVVAVLCELERRGYVSGGQKCHPSGSCGDSGTANRCADCGIVTGSAWGLTARGIALAEGDSAAS
jgi:hypothetical protein